MGCKRRRYGVGHLDNQWQGAECPVVTITYSNVQVECYSRGKLTTENEEQMSYSRELHAFHHVLVLEFVKLFAGR